MEIAIFKGRYLKLRMVEECYKTFWQTLFDEDRTYEFRIKTFAEFTNLCANLIWFWNITQKRAEFI